MRARPSGEAVTFAVLAVSVSSFALLQSLIVPVLSQIQQEYDTDQTTVTWVLTAYLLSASIATPILGRVGDAVGKKRMLVVTLVGAVGRLAARRAGAARIGWLIAARVVQGLGGGVLPLAFGIIRDEFQDRGRPAPLSVIASLTAVGFGVGIVIAGPIVDTLGYHWLFWLPMIVTVVAAVAALFLVPESPVRTPGGVPLLPAVPLAARARRAPARGQPGQQVGLELARGRSALFATAVVVGSAWVRVETRVAVPADRHADDAAARGVDDQPGRAASSASGCSRRSASCPSSSRRRRVAGYGFDATITESGHAAAAQRRRELPGRVRHGPARSVGSAPAVRHRHRHACSACRRHVPRLAFLHDTTWQLYAATTVHGRRHPAWSSPASPASIVASVPREQTGVASGMNANIRTIGGSIGSAVMAGVVTAHVGPGGFPLELGYTVGFVLLALGMACAALAAAFIPDLPGHRPSSRLTDADNAELGLVPAAPAPQ